MENFVHVMQYCSENLVCDKIQLLYCPLMCVYDLKHKSRKTYAISTVRSNTCTQLVNIMHAVTILLEKSNLDV